MKNLHTRVQNLIKAIIDGAKSCDFNISSGFMVNFDSGVMKKIAANVELPLMEETNNFLKFAQIEEEERISITYDIKSKAVIVAASKGGRY